MALCIAANAQLIDRDRVSHVLRKAGLDALVLTEPENVYYVSGMWPPLEPMGSRDTTIAIIPVNSADPIALVTYQFIYYYALCDGGPVDGIEPYLVTGPGPEGAAPPGTYLLRDGRSVSRKEQNRRDQIGAIKQFYSSSVDAVSRALSARNLQKSRIGFDSLSGADILGKAAPFAQTRDAREVVKHMRLVKTPTEIALMRKASAANVEAALLTAAKMRELGSIKSVRAEFFKQASALGNTPKFMAVDGVINDSFDDDLCDGTSVLIDCVSHYAGYHGDYGRTIFIGEPPARIRAAVSAISTTIEDLSRQLRPGLKFSEIAELGQGMLSKKGDFKVPFGPHSVGLAHTEQPATDLDGRPLDIQLEAGMIISVDCPLVEADAGGTVHMEDLMLITETGAEPIHDTSVREVSV